MDYCIFFVAFYLLIAHTFFVGNEVNTHIKVMNGLMLHCGANQVEYGEVQGTDTPEATRTHTPIPHSHLVDLVRDGLGRANMAILEESHALTHDANRYFGLFRIGTGQESSESEDNRGRTPPIQCN